MSHLLLSTHTTFSFAAIVVDANAKFHILLMHLQEKLLGFLVAGLLGLEVGLVTYKPTCAALALIHTKHTSAVQVGIGRHM